MMKKFLFALFILAISFQSFAGIKKKNIIGKWNYKIELGDNTKTGVLLFRLIDKEISGKVFQIDGPTESLSKFEIDKDKNILRFELERENDDPIKFILNINKKDFTGKGWIKDANFDITGKKQD